MKKKEKAFATIIEVKESNPFFGLLSSILEDLIQGNPEEDNKEEEKEEEEYSIPADLGYYVEKVGKKLGYEPGESYDFLANIADFYPAQVLGILFREIALELDHKYPGHISECPEVYTISLLDGTIGRTNKKLIKSYVGLAAFRTLDDARFACKITRELLKEIFRGGKQEDKGGH